MKPDTTAELSSFFEAPDFDQRAHERFSDLAYGSADTREQFSTMVGDYRKRVEAGQGEPLKLALGLFILGSYTEALQWFAKAKDSKQRRYFGGLAELALGRYADAIANFQKATSQGWDAFDADVQTGIAQIRSGDAAAAEKLARKREREGQERADWHYLRGVLEEEQNHREAAIEYYEKALTLDPDHVPVMFRCARLYDLLAEDQKAIELYQRLALQPRAHVNALINLAVLYEDRGEYGPARACLRRVLLAYPNHTRARLFLKDVESSQQMIIDDTVEQRAESRNRVLETPIAEFELSVRARNCLKKMKINTLGDLLKLSEPELLAYKNFGETSLTEIKAMLTKRGLRLGQKPEEIDVSAIAPPPPVVRLPVPPGSEAILGKPVSEMELSVRARRCLQRLNINTMGDLIQHSEAELLATRNFGATSLTEIKARLAENGLSLAPKA